LSDFDGTAVTIDTAEYALRKLAQGDWKGVDDEFVRGEISFEECLQRQFAMLKEPVNELISELEPVTFLRRNFDGFVKFCESRRVPVVIVSGGLDFYIRHFLTTEGLLDHVVLYAPKSEFTKDGLRVSFPQSLVKGSVNFKEDQVIYQKRLGEKTVYIGNGVGDYPAAKAADVAFAIKGSPLADLCRRTSVLFKEIEDFKDVAEAVKHLLGE